MKDWFARPILHVQDVDVALHFYESVLGFTSPWRYDEEGKTRVAQVERQGCVLILASNLAREKIGMAVMFISLNAGPATLDSLRAEVEEKGVPVRESFWGYRLLVIEDPDGNQLLFNYPNESAAPGQV